MLHRLPFDRASLWMPAPPSSHCMPAAEQVPPAGYATYHIKPAEEPEEDPEQADCVDKQAICAKWASDGECGRNPEFMHLECPRSCAKCAAAGNRSGATAAESNACTASSSVSGSMRCHIDEDFRDDITYYNLTTSVFNNNTNTTDVVITTHNVTSTVLDRSRVRTPYASCHGVQQHSMLTNMQGVGRRQPDIGFTMSADLDF